jgi:APA family basic amino acid/polyamine antiporter
LRAVVSAGVIVLRIKRPDIKRSFKCPGVPYLPILAILFCLGLIIALPAITHIRFIVWLLLGIMVYFSYSAKHSTMNK